MAFFIQIYQHIEMLGSLFVPIYHRIARQLHGRSPGQLVASLPSRPSWLFTVSTKRSSHVRQVVTLDKVPGQDIHAALKALKHKSRASLIEWRVSGRAVASQDYSEACSALNPCIIDGRGG